MLANAQDEGLNAVLYIGEPEMSQGTGLANGEWKSAACCHLDSFLVHLVHPEWFLL